MISDLRDLSDRLDDPVLGESSLEVDVDEEDYDGDLDGYYEEG